MPGMRLQGILGEINKSNIALQSDFQVEVHRNAKDQTDNAIARSLQFRATTFTLPGRTIQAPDYRIYGVIQRVPASVSYDTSVMMGIVLSENFQEREFFEKWQDTFVGKHRTVTGKPKHTDFDVGYYDDHVGTIKVNQLDRLGNIVYTCELLEAYPYSVSSMDQDWNAGSSYHIMNVGIYYRYYNETFKQKG